MTLKSIQLNLNLTFEDVSSFELVSATLHRNITAAIDAGLLDLGVQIEQYGFDIIPIEEKSMKLSTDCNRIAWLDLETGGLDGKQQNGTVGCDQYPILEIAVLVTDSELNLCDESGFRAVIHQDEITLANMDPWALAQHQKSGLIDEVRRSTINLAQAEKMVIEYLKRNGARAYDRKTKSGTLMAGNSIKFDRNYINCQMPELDAFFHYRQIDISTVALLCRLWKPEIEKSVQKEYRHLALQDIKESIEEARTYKKHLF